MIDFGCNKVRQLRAESPDPKKGRSTVDFCMCKIIKIIGKVNSKYKINKNSLHVKKSCNDK